MQERHTDRLLDTAGIVGTGVGLNAAGKPVIRIYTARPDVAGVPSALEGVGVERVTTGILGIRAPTDRFPRPVPIGVSSGHLNTATGTLGARVTDGTNVYALSNNHVYAASNGASIGDGIIQPGNVDGGSDPADRIGTLHAFQSINFTDGTTNTMDAAIALTSVGSVGTSTPPEGYGTPSTVPATAFVGQAVQKFGRTTGFQLGTVVEINVSVDVCYVFFFGTCFEDARFVNQVAVTPDAFSAGGDSGSLIVTQDGNRPVALLFAGGEGRTIGNPINLVLQRFGVTIDGIPPVDGPPDAPIGLTALAGDGSVSLSWTAPAFDGGSPITGYRVYRGEGSGPKSLLASVGPDTSYTDASALNGTTYAYEVAAVNALGEGPRSSEASATPTAAIAPSAPLATLDDFNRANESPLSDSGRWTNGVNGTSGEVGLQVSSNQLACSRTTTCTAWRSNTQYGPDTEVWTTVSTLAGVNNHIRLKARLQQVGTSGYDGYMLRTNELSGTDEIYLERLDNGAFVGLVTVHRDLAAGDRLLLRAQGSTLEAWLHDGAAWSRLATVSDSTYAGAGHVGIALRGTSGRLDDFGARTMSAPSPSLAITTSSLPGGTVNASYSQAVTASGGQTPYAWSVASGSLPAGLTLTSGTPSATISGTPTTAGTYAFTLEVSDGTQTASQGYSITVGAALAITTSSLPGGTVNASYSQAVTASGGQTPYAWSVASGSLPAGLTLTSGTPSATISGTPTTAGTYAFTLEVSDGTQTATRALSIVVSEDPTVVKVDSVTYTTEGGRAGNQHLVVAVQIVTGTTPIPNASVTINLVLNGALYATRTATTDSNGRAVFKFNKYPAGCYTTVVTQVTVGGQTSTPPTPTNSHCK